MPNPYSEMDQATFLRYLAQNDYMIDQHYLPEGEKLLEIADALEAEKGEKRCPTKS